MSSVSKQLQRHCRVTLRSLFEGKFRSVTFFEHVLLKSLSDLKIIVSDRIGPRQTQAGYCDQCSKWIRHHFSCHGWEVNCKIYSGFISELVWLRTFVLLVLLCVVIGKALKLIHAWRKKSIWQDTHRWLLCPISTWYWFSDHITRSLLNTDVNN